MAWIRMLGDDDASPDLRQKFDAARDPESGALDEIMRIHSLHPRGLSAHLELYQTVMAGTKSLRKVEREIIALVVSLINKCHY